MTQCEFKGIIVARETLASLFESNTLENLREKFKKYKMCKDLREAKLLEYVLKKYLITLILNGKKYSGRIKNLKLYPYRCCIIYGIYPVVPTEQSNLSYKSRIKILKILKDRKPYSEKYIIEKIQEIPTRKVKDFLHRLSQVGVLKYEAKTKEILPNVYKITEVTYKLDCNIIFI